MSIPFFSKLRSQKHYLQLVKPELKQVSEFVEAQASCFDPEVTDYMETVCQSKGKMLRPALVLLVAGARAASRKPTSGWEPCWKWCIWPHSCTMT